jgi:uncharacterized protein YdeI (YjbR/CyaY-like superfamily)
MKPIFFKTPTEFREWLQENHQTEKEVIVGFYKLSSGKPSLTWSESVDEALCFGWIDGVRRSIDHESYCNRFTPRKKSSNWSTVNINKMEVLIQQGKMTQAGLDIFQHRKDSKTSIYSYENDARQLSPDLEKLFKSQENAWQFFSSQAAYYQKTMIGWIMSAKQESTRLSRLEKTIAASAENRRMR